MSIAARITAGAAAVVVAAGLLAAAPPGAGAQTPPGIEAASPASPSGPVAAQRARLQGCQKPGARFRPRSVVMPSLNRTVRAVPIARTRSGAIGTPPTSNAGKWLMGWDRATLPGSQRGSSIMAAHTWPDGSALGNALLRNLKRGHVIRVRGAGGKIACYRVQRRQAYPHQRVPLRKAYRPGGKHQLTITVCSGRRLGPGNWTHRTVWYLKPVHQR